MSASFVAAVYDRRFRATLLCLAPFLTAIAALPTPAASVEFHLVDSKSQPVANAVVSLTPLDASIPPAPPASAEPPEISQEDQEFSPFVTAIRVGSEVRFPNRDTVQHHVYSLSKPKKFDLPLYDPGKAEVTLFDRPGVVTIGCNIHDWMLAYIVVLETPWFAVTPATGAAALRQLPPGRYRVEVWHPRLAKNLVRDIALPASGAPSLDLTLALKPDRRIHRSPDRDSAGYR